MKLEAKNEEEKAQILDVLEKLIEDEWDCGQIGYFDEVEYSFGETLEHIRKGGWWILSDPSKVTVFICALYHGIYNDEMDIELDKIHT